MDGVRRWVNSISVGGEVRVTEGDEAVLKRTVSDLLGGRMRGGWKGLMRVGCLGGRADGAESRVRDAYRSYHVGHVGVSRFRVISVCRSSMVLETLDALFRGIRQRPI